MKPFKNLISGQWVGAKKTFPVYNPYTNAVIGEVPDMDFETIHRAIESANRYESALSAYERYGILMKTAREVLEKKDELSRLISLESGLCLKSTRHEIDRAYQALIFSAEEAKRLEGSTYPIDIVPNMEAKVGLTIYQPVGVVLTITPFNHPLNQVVHKVGPALAANNKVILKPSEKTPLTAIKFAEILLNNGLPSQMLSVVTCDIKKIADQLLSHPKIDMVAFTGSTAVGESIHQKIGIKKSLLELGGNDVFIVLEDADIEKAVDIAVKGAFGNSGQRCTSIKRILLQNTCAKPFIQRFVQKTKQLKTGDPFDEKTDVGTLISEMAARNVERVIKAAIHDGAKLLCGGKRARASLTPAILDHVDPASEIVVKETFGPTAPIIRFDTIEEAIRIANNTPFGLQAGVATENINKALTIAKRLQVGGVMINEGPGFRMEPIPFGGIKKSGLGREGIQCAVREMSNLKLIVM